MVDINPQTEDISEFQGNHERPPSEQLVELHIYLVPKEKWLEKRKLAKNQAVDHTISVGFVRVLPQTYLSELRKEMHRQLGIESVPKSFVFLRSVGRNFTQVRPKQEMEMKVKNYMPPYAPEPELYVKEGTYTGSSTWSQGEDSGLEESLADSNSQRSHDRATPESLSDDHVVLPKLTDYLGIPPRPDTDDQGGRASMPPAAMTVSMSADDLSNARFHRAGNQKGSAEVPLINRGGTFQFNHRLNFEEMRHRKLKDRSQERPLKVDDHGVDASTKSKTRGSSWNRNQKRGTSKDRGGTQLPTWAETRTTRLRRNKALGDNQNSNQSSKAKKNSNGTDKKDASANKVFEGEEEAHEDDTGAVLMERIRANSRCLKARMSAQTKKATISDTGMGAKHNKLKQHNGEKDKKGHNGVYTMHTRRNLRGGAEEFDDRDPEPQIENTTIKLIGEQGEELSREDTKNLPMGQKGTNIGENPEIVNYHVMDIEGEDARKTEHENSKQLLEEKEETTNHNNKRQDKSNSNKKEEVQPNQSSTNHNAGVPDHESQDSPDYSRSSNESKDDNYNSDNVNDLEEGRLVNDNGRLTIEIEVKALDSSADTNGLPVATVDSNLTPVPVDDSTEYDSYRVYSEQNLPNPPQDQGITNVRSSRKDRDLSPTEADKENRARQARGVYLRRLEHRKSNAQKSESSDNIPHKVGGSPSRHHGNARSISQTRKNKARMEKWSVTAASTGDLTEASWDYSHDKERLLMILNDVRRETSMRQKHREELLKRIKQLQNRAHQRREQVREMWRKRYVEAKKVTPRLEEECSRLRQELEKLHRELLAKVQAGVWALLTISGKTERPSNKLSYKIMIARLLQEIEDLTRRVEGTRLKLHTELKLRSMAEKDVRSLREELLKKKIQVTLTRNQEQAAMGNGIREQYFISAV